VARGHLITPQVEALVASIHRKHPRWKAPTVCNEVRSILRKKNPQSPKNWPSLSAVQKILATVRKNVAKIRDRDKPWSMGTLNENPVPSEAIPAVLNVWKLHVARKEGFSIRKAQWVARLSGLPTFEGASASGGVKGLAAMATVYAELEAIYEDAGHSAFDTGVLDCLILGIPVDEVRVGVESVHRAEVMLDTLAYLVGATSPDSQIKPDFEQNLHWAISFGEDLAKLCPGLEETAMNWQRYKKEAQ